VFDTILYSGNNSTQSITSLAFNPDMVWSKCRNVGRSHRLSDAIRGSNVDLYTDTTASDNFYGSGSITAFTANGFNLDNSASSQYNTSGETYVSWCWDAGTSTVTNNSGSISSQVRANATAGFSVVTYTGNGTQGATFGHGLGVDPSFLIIKRRNDGSSSSRWWTFHKSVTSPNGNWWRNYAQLDLTNGFSDWGDNGGLAAAPSSTLITVGTYAGINSSSGTYVCYAWTPVVGHSSFGSYTGNGSSTNGPFVYTGFRPRFILTKAIDSGLDWNIFDAARDSYNSVNKVLFPNLSNQESDYIAYTPFDFLSNGFKLRSSIVWNASSTTYIYAAFAEAPFNYSRAR
jgi:hypothetical protein